MNSLAHPPLSPETASKLLSLLSTDDTFRAEFLNNPSRALAKIGYKLPVNITPPCLSIHKLATKEEFEESAELLKRNLTSAAGLTIVFSYESGKIDQALNAGTYPEQAPHDSITKLREKLVNKIQANAFSSFQAISM